MQIRPIHGGQCSKSIFYLVLVSRDVMELYFSKESRQPSGIISIWDQNQMTSFSLSFYLIDDKSRVTEHFKKFDTNINSLFQTKDTCPCSAILLVKSKSTLATKGICEPRGVIIITHMPCTYVLTTSSNTKPQMDLGSGHFSIGGSSLSFILKAITSSWGKSNCID